MPPKTAQKAIRYIYSPTQPPLKLICHDAFGDGKHPTTKMCIQLLLATLKKRKPASLCDIGTGSGILSLIAYRYGIRDILALDYDKTAVARTKQNMRKNKARFQVRRRDIIRQPVARQYDLVIANMNSAILEAAWKNILAPLDPHGTLIISGIGTQWIRDIRRIVSQSKCIIKAERQHVGWWAAICVPAPKGVK